MASSPTGELPASTVSCDYACRPFARGKPSPPPHWQHEMGDELFCRTRGIVPGWKPQPPAPRAGSKTEQGMQQAGKGAEGAVLPVLISSRGRQRSRPPASAAVASPAVLGAPLTLAGASLPGAAPRPLRHTQQGELGFSVSCDSVFYLSVGVRDLSGCGQRVFPAPQRQVRGGWRRRHQTTHQFLAGTTFILCCLPFLCCPWVIG